MSQDLENSTTDNDSLTDNEAEIIEAGLLASLYRHNCPDTMQLGAYQQKSLTQTEQSQIESHLNSCSHCRAELTRLNDFLKQDIPALSKKRAWFKGYGFEWRKGKAGKIVLRLTALSLLPPSPAKAMAVKGPDAPANTGDIIRHITLTPEETGDVDLSAIIKRIPGDPAHYILAVQVESPSRWPDLAGTMVSASAGSWRADGETDEGGLVIFEGTPADQLDGLLIEVKLPAT